MKKVLLATSALTLLAGAAAADISLSGSARMGLSQVGGGNVSGSNRMRLNVKMSTTTDAGWTAGAFGRFQSTNTGTGAWSGAQVFIGNDMFTLTTGNTSGAVDNTAGIWSVPSVGFNGSGYWNLVTRDPNSFQTGVSFSSGNVGANIVRLDMNLGMATISASTQGQTPAGYEVAAAFNVGGAKIGVGYDAGSGNAGGASGGGWVATASTSVGAINLAGAIGNLTGSNGTTAQTVWSFGLSTDMGAGTLKAFASQTLGGGNTTQQNYGLGYSMALGGGVSANLGIVSYGGTTRWDAGVNMSF